MIRPTKLELDSSALVNNLRRLKSWAGEGAFLCPMVKANAYGHGDALVARVIENAKLASALGVALVEEAVHLRKCGIGMPLLAFAPVEENGMADLLEHHITPVAGRFEDLRTLAASGETIGLHLKFNTGMNRLGFDPGELDELRAFLKRHPRLKVEGTCTHLTHGGEAHEANGPTQTQLARFHEMSKGFPGLRHAHKSASLCALHEHGAKIDPTLGSRPGISLYGLPYDGHRLTSGLEPALRWSTALNRVHKVAKGEAVGYGAKWIAPRPSLIGVIPVGYGDGYMRALSNKGEMLYRGQRVPVVGVVCMDYTFLDLTAAVEKTGDEPKAGERVVILGRDAGAEVSAGELAEKAGTIAYEIATSISRRVVREVI